MAGSVPSISFTPRADRLSGSLSGLLRSARQGDGHVWRRLAFALQVRRERRALAHLGDAALKDIGRSRADATREAGRGFWDLPRGR